MIIIPMVTFYTPKCCKLQDDSFPLYYTAGGVGGGGGERYSSVHAHVITCDPLPVVQALTSCSSMPSKKIME